MLSRKFGQYILGLVFLVSSSFVFSNTEFTYNIIEGGIEVTGCVNECPSDLVIPEEIDGYSLIKVGFGAFYNKQLTSVTIPNTVISIDGWAFSGNQLTNLAIPNSLNSIGPYGFAENQLTNLTISDTITFIGNYAFYKNQLSSVTISNSLTTIEPGVFSENQLTNVTIPDNITKVGFDAFYDNQLTNITIPNSVTDIGPWAFSGNSLTSVTIPYSVTSIGGSAFDDGILDNLTFLGGPPVMLNSTFSFDSLATITFCHAENNDWETIVIEGIVPSYDEECDLNESADTGIPELSNVEFTYIIIEDGIEVTGCVNECPSDLVIPEVIDGYSLTKIGFGAFYDKQLTSVTIPDTVTSIDGWAFSRNQLTNLAIPNSLNSIGPYGFAENQLTSLTIPDTVTFVGDYAFSVNELTSVTIPNSLTSIEPGVFSVNQLTNVAIPDNVTSIGFDAFFVNDLTSVTIPNNVATIGAWAFSGNQLTSVIIPNSIKNIGTYAFDTISDNLTFLGEPPVFLSTTFDINSQTSVSYCQNNDDAWDVILIENIVPMYDENCGMFEGNITWDFDKNYSLDALTDGLLLLRYAFGLRSDNLTNSTIGSGSTLTPEEVESNIEEAMGIADIDSDGFVSPLTDGLLLLRYIFGLRGSELINKVVSAEGTRTSASEIEAYIEYHTL